MLEAADDFVTTMTTARSDVGLAVFPTVIAAISRRDGHVDPERQEAAEGAFRIANAHWTEADGHVPRITLLFGVGSGPAQAARQASDTLGASLVQLARVKATAGYDGDDLGDLDDIIERCSVEADKAAQELDEFSHAARKAIEGWYSRRVSSAR